MGMANRQKSKGDIGEREALAKLRELISDLLVDGNDRAKSAGIPHDRGDLHALDDTAVQVKHWGASRLGSALLEAAFGAELQASAARKPHSLGMSSISGAPKAGVRWLASMVQSEADHLGLVPVVEFKSITPLRAWIVDDRGPAGYLTHPRRERVCTFTTRGRSIIVAPIEAWAHRYEARKAVLAS